MGQRSWWRISRCSAGCGSFTPSSGWCLALKTYFNASNLSKDLTTAASTDSSGLQLLALPRREHPPTSGRWFQIDLGSCCICRGAGEAAWSTSGWRRGAACETFSILCQFHLCRNAIDFSRNFSTTCQRTVRQFRFVSKCGVLSHRCLGLGLHWSFVSMKSWRLQAFKAAVYAWEEQMKKSSEKLGFGRQ